MADPKYAHLPGIAYDQPDVYETGDLPEDDQVQEDQDEDSDSIERVTISATEAFTKFKDKILHSENVDFSDRIGRRCRIGYDIRSGDWEIVPAGEKETPLQRYQRLQCETKELIEEISAIKDDGSKDPRVSGLSGEQVENLLEQLESLKLEKSLDTELIGSLTDPQGSQIKKLITQLEKLTSKKNGDGDNGKQGKGQEGEVKYQVNAKTNQAQLAQATRLADLEARVTRLNSIVATTPNTIKRLGAGDKSLVDTAKWVSGKIALLESSQLDATETRISNLLPKLDQLAEKSAMITGSNTTEGNKIAELYELVKTTEEMSQVLPKALERMLTLEALHRQGTEFAKSLSELESLQTVLNASCESNKQLLQGLEKKIAADLISMKSTMEGFDARIKTLAAKSKK